MGDNIPTIHVGRALADSLPTGWGDEEWAVYMNDIVHPTDAGYKFYYNVIEEFMYNSLVAAEYDGTTAEHEMPELQSDTLFNGNVEVIIPSEEMITKSEELGGNGFVYSSKNYTVDNYVGFIEAYSADSPNAELIVEFTGTELVALCAGHEKTASKFLVSVDGGEYVEKLFNTHNPTVIVEGLRSAKHTVSIKPVMSTISTKIYIGAFYSRDEAYQTAKTTSINYGDVDADETIGVLDLVRLKKLVAEQGTYCPPADIDGDGKMDAPDLAKLRKHMLGIELIGEGE